MTAKKKAPPGNGQDGAGSWEPEPLFAEGQGPAEDLGIVDSLQRQVESVRTQLTRSQADFANLRKRSRDEQARTIRYANESLVSNLLPILDDFRRALDASETGQDGVHKEFADGMRMVADRFLKLLEREGLEAIEATGKRFDPFLHEAVLSRKQDGVEPGTVLEVFQTGYLFQGRLLRAAQVAVVPGSPKPRAPIAPSETPVAAATPPHDATTEAAPDAAPEEELDVEMDAEIVDENTQPTVDIDVELIDHDDPDDEIPVSHEEEPTHVSPPPGEADWEIDVEILDEIEPEARS